MNLKDQILKALNYDTLTFSDIDGNWFEGIDKNDFSELADRLIKVFNTNIMKKVFNYEIYLKSPESGQGGWEIHFVNVYAANETEADSVLKTYPRYDKILTRFGEVENYGYDDIRETFRRVPLGEQQTYERKAKNF